MLAIDGASGPVGSELSPDRPVAAPGSRAPQ